MISSALDLLAQSKHLRYRSLHRSKSTTFLPGGFSYGTAAFQMAQQRPYRIRARHRVRVLGQNKATARRRAAVAAAGQRAVQMRLFYGDVQGLRRKNRRQAIARYLRQVQTESEHADQRPHLRILSGTHQVRPRTGPRVGGAWMGPGRVPLYAHARSGAGKY